MSNAYENEIAAVRGRLLTLLTDNEILGAGIAAKDYGTRLDELGVLDSMGLVQAVGIVEDEYGVEIPLELLVTELTSIDAIAGYVAGMWLQEAA